jgi:hypothetical protein
MERQGEPLEPRRPVLYQIKLMVVASQRRQILPKLREQTPVCDLSSSVGDEAPAGMPILSGPAIALHRALTRPRRSFQQPYLVVDALQLATQTGE